MIDGMASLSPLPCCTGHLPSCTPLSSGHYEHTTHTHTLTENTLTYTLSLGFTLSSAFRQGHSALFPQNTPSVKYHCWKQSGRCDSLCARVCVIQICRLGWNSERPLVQEQSLRIYGYVLWLHIVLQACVTSQVAQLQ